MKYILAMSLLAAIGFALCCLAYIINYFRISREEERQVRMCHEERREVDIVHFRGNYPGETPPANYANNDRTDYIY